MTEKRIEKIIIEAQRRIDLWLKNEDWQEMTCEGSKLRFEMSIGLNGMPFRKEKWMYKFNKFVNDKEVLTFEYDAIINILFNKYKPYNYK